MGFNLYTSFADVARRQPGHPALLGPGPRDQHSYGELHDAVIAAADRLKTSGIARGDCVGLHYASGANYIVLNYAIWRCGACVVPIPIELAPPEKQQIVRSIALQHVVTSASTAAFAAPYCRGKKVEVFGDAMVTRLASPRQPPGGFAAIPSAFIRFTSGTTGACKGVVLSHESIRDRIAAANEALRLGAGDRVVWVLSMAYHFAVSIVGYLSHGAAIVLPANHLGRGIVDAARDHRATLIYAAPVHYAWMAGAAAAPPLPELRLAISTTSPLDSETARRFSERFGLPITQALGIIEVGLPFINTAFAQRHPEGLGRALPAYEMRLDNSDIDAALGEILLRGPGFLDAYYEPWQTRTDILKDGWFRTGDIGTVDGNGCLFLRGRRKELINVQGLKFFPQEVEAVLGEHPLIKSACVFAHPERRLGEVAHARIVVEEGASLTETELSEFCRQRLATFKVPHRFEFVSSLVRTGSGKMLRRRIPKPAESA